MGHIIGWDVCEDNKKSILIMLSEINEKAIREGDTGHGIGPVKWLRESHVFPSRSDAEKYIEENLTGWYDNVAVRYMDYSDASETAKIKQLKEAIEKLAEAKAEYKKIHSIQNRKAEYIGCPKCGSKLSKAYLRSSNCPVCRASLICETDIARLESYDKRIAATRDKIEAEKMKQKSKAKQMVLIRFEFHC